MAYKKELVLKAIEGSGGYVSVIAERIGCTIQTVYNFIKRWPDVEAAIYEENESKIDFVESKLQDRIREGDTTAIIFFLKTRGRSRGYEQHQYIEHSEKPEPVREWRFVDPPKRKVSKNGKNGVQSEIQAGVSE